MKENKFQSDLINEIKDRFKGAVVLKNDEQYMQGVPDLTILYKNHWAILEVKRAQDSPKQPNQEYYVDMFNAMSYSRFISPENKEEVLDELQRTFQTSRSTRISKRK